MDSYQPKDMAIYNTTKNLACFLGKLFEEEIKKDQIPEYVKKTLQIINAYSPFAIGQESKLFQTSLYFEFFYQYKTKIEASAEFKAMSSSINNNSTVNKHFEKWVGTEQYKENMSLMHNFLAYILLPVLVKSNIIESGKFVFDEDTFNKLYWQAEQFFYSDIIQFKERIILYNLNLNCDGLTFYNGIIIRKLTTEEVDNLETHDTHDLFLKHLAPRNAGLCEIYKIFETPKVISEEPNRIQIPSQENTDKNKILDQLIMTTDAIELFGNGNIGKLYADSISINNPFLDHDLQIPYKLHNDWFDVGNVFVFNSNQIAGFEKFLVVFEKVRNLKEIKIALNRFKYGRLRDDPVDRIIDYMIAFDSLFGSGGRSIAQRVSILITNNENAQKTISPALHQAYEKFRSRIVHGGEPEKIVVAGEETSEVDLSTLIQYLLRVSLKGFIALRNSDLSHNDIKLLLDDALFDSKSEDKLRKIVDPYLENEEILKGSPTQSTPSN